VIFNANGDNILSYEWGLFHTSNNRAEALALYQGLIQLGKLGIDTFTILGDSAIVVSAMVQNMDLPNALLQQIIRRCRILANTMKDVRYYHVLRSLNKIAESQANKACARSLGCLICNGMESFQHIP